MKTVAGITFTLAMLVLALVLGSGLARADANDEQFLNTLTLHEMGCTSASFIHCSGGEQDLIDIGKSVCAKRRQHHLSESDVEAILMRAAARQGPDKIFTDDMAVIFVQAAEKAYCPDLLGH